ncbi:hypothetical protein J7W19_27285 [Streptomyces mobaraensis NBRC 13819 = DSM 40847]|uniref:hypothetical protein n=1 Tax=Streptomyces mobaraensis TaxID=35621 RepID=UPI00034B4BE3|nr:hypothetical protein [Streptomyces mobaraensis]QTT76589.1 hypothetical protein J7W19_27285 [Streptomyces mobaraensis NBRC 13819 = DSM 40847]
MYKRRSKEQPSEPPPPVGTAKATRLPMDVRIGDFVLLNGSYQRVRDMRAAGTSAYRILLFAGHAPLVMRTPRTVYRPITWH